MTPVRDQSDASMPAPDGPSPTRESASSEPANRLNLLLSFSGWQRESWADRLPTLLEPMGVTALRADTGRQATEVIQTHPIHIAVVDLGLPLDLRDEAGSAEEGGLRLLDVLRRLDPTPPTVVVKRGRSHRDDTRELNAALRTGAFAVVDRPASARGLETMLDVLARALTRFYQGRWPTQRT